ncbi:hypothetical protein [Rhodoblastus sp.]|uniref:hypothetical protein n=1 Tax=Rhodoblastus sp. TaxID=1962975 RepID=UPI003F981D6F
MIHFMPFGVRLCLIKHARAVKKALLHRTIIIAMQQDRRYKKSVMPDHQRQGAFKGLAAQARTIP